VAAVTRLSEAQVESGLKPLTGWRREGDYITKEFRFKTFLAGIRFVDAVALVAEAQEHHPDIQVVWTTVTLKIQTHEEGGLTKWDLDLAKAIEKDISRAKKGTAAAGR
jgi:4a-hydroxytetrahydrobiopterin dehydratase